jgi:hypothetical protein
MKTKDHGIISSRNKKQQERMLDRKNKRVLEIEKRELSNFRNRKQMIKNKLKL